MKPLLALLTSLAVGVGSAACGETSRHAGSASRTTSVATAAGSVSTTTSAGAARTLQHLFGDYDSDDYYNEMGQNDDHDNDDIDKPTDHDNDSDGTGNSYYDSDDSSVRTFGHAASAADSRAIAGLVKSYYAAAGTGDGAKACSLILSTLANAVPVDQGQGGPPYLHGVKTCAGIMSKLFEQYRRQLSAYATKLAVTGVRLLGSRGLAVLGFKPLPGRWIEVERDHGVWKIAGLLDNELP